MSVNDIMNTSKAGIYAAQNSLQTVSHNISNANTPGYSRQSLPLQSVAGANGSTGGGGVQMGDITRQLDKLVDRRQELGTGELGRLGARDRLLTLIEQTFNNMGKDGFGQRLDALYTAADGLADGPTNPVLREDFVSRANGVATLAQEMYQSLSEAKLPMDQEVDVKIADINSRLKNIRDVNNVIVRNSANGPSPDLKDQRRRMVLELGKLLDIQTLELPHDGLQIMAPGGQLLADQVYTATLGRNNKIGDTGFRGIIIDNRELDPKTLKGGELGGLLEVRDQVVNGANGFLTRMESLVDEIRFQFNVVNSTSVSQGMFTNQTSAFDLGRAENSGLLDIRLPDLPAKAREVGYTGAMLDDVQRITEGDIVFASGTDANHLTLSTVHITPADTFRDGVTIPGMTIRQIQNAINESGAVRAVITKDNRLQLTAVGNGRVYGVLSDSSHALAALGIGAIFGGTGARDMVVSPDLTDDSRLLGTGKFTIDDASNPAKVSFDDSNNRGALALSAIRNANYNIGGNTATLMGHYATIVGNLGSIVSQNRESFTSQQAAQDFIGTMRESVSGVSMEQELTDLIRFQRAFQASSKMVGVVNELMQSVIAMV